MHHHRAAPGPPKDGGESVALAYLCFCGCPPPPELKARLSSTGRGLVCLSSPAHIWSMGYLAIECEPECGGLEVEAMVYSHAPECGGLKVEAMVQDIQIMSNIKDDLVGQIDSFMTRHEFEILAQASMASMASMAPPSLRRIRASCLWRCRQLRGLVMSRKARYCWVRCLGFRYHWVRAVGQVSLGWYRWVPKSPEGGAGVVEDW